MGHVHGHVVNVSGTGFLFVCSERFEVEELVEMEITINPLFVIRCAARIVRAEPIGDGEWAFGAVFHSLTGQDMSILSETLVAIQSGQADDALSFRPRRPLGAS
jgi:hypothetical protein